MTQPTYTTEEIATLLGVSRKHVTDRVVSRPGFPAPVIRLSQRTRQWAQADVLAYLKDGPPPARPTPGSTSRTAPSSPGAR